jgi:uncharacterized membrane protein YbhN (UPF0104 family)
MQLNKNIKIFINYFLGPLLFVWLSYSIYRQIVRQPQLGESWRLIRASFQSSEILYLVGAIALIPANWGLEAWKWQLSVRQIYPVSFVQACKAVLSGVSFSVTMPNRVGDYLGRMMYLPEGSRLKTISVTLVGSFAQLLVTLVCGTVGLVLMKDLLLQHFPGWHLASQFVVYGLVMASVVCIFLYFHAAAAVGLFRRWIRSEKYLYLVEALHYFNRRLLLQVLLLSLLRYLVFVVQYIFIFYLFGVYVTPVTIMLVMSIVFLAMAIVPSIALVEVWLRGKIMIMLMGLFSTNILGTGFASVTVWFLNLIVPAIAGSILLLNLRVFRKRRGEA